MRYSLTIAILFTSSLHVWGTTIAPCRFVTVIDFQRDVRCHGDSTGVARIEVEIVNGDTNPYTIEWFDGNTSWQRTDLPAGTHFYKVTDNTGCFLNEFVTIEEPDELEIELQLKDVLCFGGSTGSIDLTVQGGMMPYTYTWSNSDTDEDIINLEANDYSVTVTDTNGCMIQGDGTINQPEPLGISPTILPVSCPGGDDGRINTVVFGGVLPYRYFWSQSDTIPNVIDLSAGNYALTITDGNNCRLTGIYRVPAPPEIEITFQVTDLSCFEEPDGSVLATVIGGTPGYRYQWSNSGFVLGDTTNNPDGLLSDFYKLEVTDANGCLQVDSTFVDQPSPLVLNLEATDATCFNKPDGLVDMTVSGGRGPYAPLWSTGSREQDIGQLLSGTYTVVVTDVTGCTQFAEIFVGQPDSLDFQVEITDVSCKDQVDGQISINPVGGTPGYVVEWNNGSIDFDLFELPGAEYSATLVDAQDCEYTGTFEVVVNPGACITVVTIPTVFTPNGDGINDVWRIKNYEVYPNMQVEVYTKWGRSVFSSVGYNNPWNGRSSGSDLPSDTYYYIVDLNNGDPPFNGFLTLVR